MSGHGGHSAHSQPKLAVRKLIEAPSLHQDWDEQGKSKIQEERKVSWSELFFDLFYVVASINMSHNFEAHLSLEGFGSFFLYFTYFFTIWSTLTIFQSRFKFSGLVFDYGTLIYMLGVLGMILHSSDTKHYKQFAASFAVCRVVMTLNFVVAAVSIPRAKIAGSVNALTYLVIAIMAAASTAGSWTTFIIISIVILVLEVVAPLHALVIPSARIPLHVDHVGERYGLLMMIFLGETVVSLGQQPLTYEVDQYVAIALGAVICYNLHHLYYHGHPDQHLHALRVHRYRGLLWSHCHWFLGAAFLMVGTAIRIVVASYVDPSAKGHRRMLLAAAPAAEGPEASGAHHKGFHAGEVSDKAAWLLCVSYGLALHIMAVIRAAHYMSSSAFLRYRDQMGLKKITQYWWGLVFIWPFAAYFMAFANGSMHGVGLLAYLAVHGILFNIAETVITHLLSRHLEQHGLDSQHGSDDELAIGQPAYIPIECCREEFMREFAARHCGKVDVAVAGGKQDSGSPLDKA